MSKVKVKFALEQAMRGSRGIAPLLLQLRRLIGVGGKYDAPIFLPPGRRTGTWVGPRAGLEGCGKFRPYTEFFLALWLYFIRASLS